MTKEGVEPAATGADLTAPPDVLDLITSWFTTVPDRLAIVDRNTRITYRQLDRQSAETAARLREQVPAGGGVAICARLGVWAIVGMLAALRAGLRYVPIDMAFPPERQMLMLQAGDIAYVLREPGTSQLGDADARPAGRNAPAGMAYSCFTSGSTGTPKRVDVPVTALAYSTAARLAYYKEPVRSFLLCSSISFDSSVAGIYWTLACGGTLIIPSEQPADLMALTRAAAAENPSHLLMVPSLYRLTLSGPVAARLAGLDVVVAAGEKLTIGLLRDHLMRMPRTALFNEYGPTECTVWSTVHRCTAADLEAGTVPIGTPIPGTRLYIRDPSTGGSVAPGQIGELWIGGPGVVLPTSDGLYRTGDLVRLSPDGNIEFHGRFDMQLKVGGVRIELDEVERVLQAQKGVATAAVGVADRHGELPRLTGFVVPDGTQTDPRTIRAGMLRRLPAGAVPGAIVLVDRLPSQPNGKIDRLTLNKLTTTD
jgi:amino acid adenylation domain-containing protein